MFQYQRAEGVLSSTMPQGGDLERLLGQLWASRLLAFGGAGLGAIGALLVSLAWPPTFQATAQLYIDPQNLRLMERELTPAVPSTDAGVVLIESQARILESASVLARVSGDLDLINDAEFAGTGSNPLQALVAPLLGSDGTAEQRVLTSLSKAVHAVRLDRTYIVEVHAKSEDADKAADIANGVVTAYFSLRDEQRAEQADEASRGLESRLAELLSKLEADEDAVQAFRIEHGMVATNGALLVETQMAQANQSLAAAREALQLAEARLGQLQALARAPVLLAALPETAASSNLARLRAEVDAAAREVESLSATLGPLHPELMRASAKARATSSAFTAALAQLISSAGLERDRARTVQANAQAELDRLVGSVQVAGADQVQLRQLTREAEASRAIYEEALLRARETREQAQLSTVNAFVVSEALPPTSRSFPPRLSVLLPAALLAGFVAGLGLALVADRLPQILRGRV